MKKVSNIDYKAYSKKQYDKIYRSTIYFEKFISKYIDLNSKNIIDLGCGGGANTLYLAKKYSNSNFLGVDISENLLKMGNNKLKDHKNIQNLKFKRDNWVNIHRYKKDFDGIISFQTLSFLPFSYKVSLKNLNKNNFEFLAFSSLFYNGKCNYKIEIDDFSIKKNQSEKTKYIFSINTLKSYLKSNGYKNFKYLNFNIDIDLPKPKHGGTESYTMKLENKKRIIFSGGLYLPYGFILAY